MPATQSPPSQREADYQRQLAREADYRRRLVDAAVAMAAADGERLSRAEATRRVSLWQALGLVPFLPVGESR